MEDLYFDQAMATLKDAVFVSRDVLLMQSRSRPSPTGSHLPNEQTRANIMRKLARASDRIARRGPIKTEQDEEESNMIVWRYSDSNSAFPEELFGSCTLVYIEGFDVTPSARERDLQLEAAMILYNFALAVQCHAKSCSVALHRSFRLYTSAYEIVCENAIDDGGQLTGTRLVLGVLSLTQMVQIQREMGRENDEYISLQEQLGELTQAFERIQGKLKKAAARGTKTTAMAA